MLTLSDAVAIVDAALAEGRRRDFAPLVVAALDAGGHLVAFKREDGAGIARFDIAFAKAWGSLGMGFGSRELTERAAKNPAFIAGDAAHQQPPFFGQGMCQGLRDVTNVIWKLDRVLKGTSDDCLLDTYTVERKRHVVELTSRIKAVGQTICERDPVAARRRDSQALAEGGGQARTITRQEIIPPLREGLLAQADTPARGALFPQPRVVSDGTSRLLDQAIGAGWRLILDGRKGDAPQDLRAICRRAGFAVATVAPPGGSPDLAPMMFEQDGVLAAWFDRHGASAALVRPDHYVFGAVDDFAGGAALVEDAARRLEPGARSTPKIGDRP